VPRQAAALAFALNWSIICTHCTHSCRHWRGAAHWRGVALACCAVLEVYIMSLHSSSYVYSHRDVVRVESYSLLIPIQSHWGMHVWIGVFMCDTSVVWIGVFMCDTGDKQRWPTLLSTHLSSVHTYLDTSTVLLVRVHMWVHMNMSIQLRKGRGG